VPDVLRARPSLLIPAGSVVGLMLLWAIHDGGYDADTWYWGALAVLGLLALVSILGITRRALSRASVIALALLGAYVAWSYLSMSWAQTPGSALEGSNRALLYALVFALFLVLPWRAPGALLLLSAYAIGIGVIAIVLLFRFASHDHLAGLFIDGRLAAPTGYFNSTVALFMIDALLATVLATRRALPGAVRGLLIGCACASLQLCVVGQSRGWLFTLPVVLVLAAFVVRDRLRVVAAATLPLAAALIPVHRLLSVYRGHTGNALNSAAMGAGHSALLLCAAMAVIATLAAWAETLKPPPAPSARARRAIGTAIVTVVVAAAVGGSVAATHGDPFSFIKRQWHGFVHPSSASASSSHFAAVGTGRYDFWRVAFGAAAAHPLGGLGQDNYGDYYLPRRRTYEAPRWTHSIELRLLAHTGIVGTVLFAAFLAAALAAAARSISRAPPAVGGLAAAAMLPLVVWLTHGSVDWFWEMPALSGPALGFLGMAIALGSPPAQRSRSWTPPRPAAAAAALIAVAVGVCVLGFPYLAVRELSTASDNQTRNPVAALAELKTAADLNPLSPEPTRLAGMIALQTGRYLEARQRFKETVSRNPGGWFGWLGAGLTATTLGDVTGAERDFRMAVRLNPRGETVHAALERVRTLHPLTPAQALSMLQTE